MKNKLILCVFSLLVVLVSVTKLTLNKQEENSIFVEHDEINETPFPELSKRLERISPKRLTRKDVSNGELRFAGVASVAVFVPKVSEMDKSNYGFRVVAGTTDYTLSKEHILYQKQALEFAIRYNKEKNVALNG